MIKNCYNKIKKFHKKYNKSYKKEFYMHFNDVHEIEDFRMSLLIRIANTKNDLQYLQNLNEECNKNIIKMYNNIMYLELLIKKIN